MNEHTYSIIPFAGYGALVFGALALLPLLLVGFLFYSSRYATFQITPEGLRIRGDIYGRFIPADQLRIEEARAVSLGSEPAVSLTWRTNGASFPGYKAGWFRTKDGGKALAFVTDTSKVAAVPTTAGYVVLMSVQDPAAFVGDLRATIAGQRR